VIQACIWSVQAPSVIVHLKQEIDRMQIIINLTRSTLELAIAGTVIMTPDLINALNTTFDARVPPEVARQVTEVPHLVPTWSNVPWIIVTNSSSLCSAPYSRVGTPTRAPRADSSGHAFTDFADGNALTAQAGL
jgi:hypothetical protein